MERLNQLLEITYIILTKVRNQPRETETCRYFHFYDNVLAIDLSSYANARQTSL